MDNVVNTQAKIPRHLTRTMDVHILTKAQRKDFVRAFLRRRASEDMSSMVAYKAMVLHYARPKKKKNNKSKKARGLNAQQKREMKVFQIKPEHQRYELFLPLHNLWRQYIIDLCNGLKPTCSPQLVQQKLLKADLHGAIITVVRSKCPSYVGTTGILVQEFKHVFKIITQENRLKVIPKRNCVFAVEINGFVSHIYGNKFEQRASERSAKKFKVRGTIDL